MKSKKAQFFFAGIMIAIMGFIVLVQFITPIKDQVIDARSASKLDCDNSSISVGVKATCIIVDWYLPYFIAMGIAASIAFLTGKVIRGSKG